MSWQERRICCVLGTVTGKINRGSNKNQSDGWILMCSAALLCNLESGSWQDQSQTEGHTHTRRVSGGGVAFVERGQRGGPVSKCQRYLWMKDRVRGRRGWHDNPVSNQQHASANFPKVVFMVMICVVICNHGVLARGNKTTQINNKNSEIMLV